MKKFFWLAMMLTLMLSMTTNAQTVNDTIRKTGKFETNNEVVFASSYLYRSCNFADKPMVSFVSTGQYNKFSYLASFDVAPFNNTMVDVFLAPSYKLTKDIQITANYFYWGNYNNNKLIAKNYLDGTIRLYDFLEVSTYFVNPEKDYAACASVSKQFQLSKYKLTPKIQIPLNNSTYYGNFGTFAVEARLLMPACKFTNWSELTIGYTTNQLVDYTYLSPKQPNKFYVNLSVAMF